MVSQAAAGWSVLAGIGGRQLRGPGKLCHRSDRQLHYDWSLPGAAAFEPGLPLSKVDRISVSGANVI